MFDTNAVKKELERIKLSDFSVDGFSKSEYTQIKLQDVSLNEMDKKVHFFGWVTNCRAGKKFSFLDLTSHFATVKLVMPTNAKITIQTSLRVYGVVKSNAGNDKNAFEVMVDAYEVYNGYQAPPFPLNANSEKESLLDYAHLGLRMEKRALFLEAQSELLKAIRMYYWSKKYTEITPPTLVQTQVEGGATLFKLDYYGEPAYLTQSSQLYLETTAPVAGKAFCIMPSYRAEKSRTSRHLSEFTHVEAELVDVTFGELMDQIEQLVRSAINGFYDSMLDKIKSVYPDFEPVKLSDEPFKKISYKDAIDFLAKHNHKKTDGTDYKQGDDIADASEKFIIEEFGKNQPVFLTRFPVEHKPFYVSKDVDGTETCDLLFPGMGEIVGGSMRHTVYDDLIDGFKREDIDTDPYYWYLDMSKYGPSPHGGYGLGFERLLMCIMKYKSVDQGTLYCRKPSRCTP